MTSFKEIQEAFDSILLLADRDVIRLISATVIGNQMHLDPIWLMLVASSSGGKSTIIQMLDDLELPDKHGDVVPCVFPISDLTENSFASGYRRSDKDASLLHRLPWGGIMTFKDFTSIISKRRETRDIIMSQLREVYDGKYHKHTGLGDDINWHGKVGAIAGVTEAVYEYMDSMSVMGDRFVMYSMVQPDRVEMLKFIMNVKRTKKSKEDELRRVKDMYQEYLLSVAKKLDTPYVELDEENEEEIIQIGDFCTKVRSGVVEDPRTGDIKFVPQREMPTRMVEQLLAIGSALSLMRSLEPGADGEKKIPREDLELLYKIAFDSIPVKRRIALKYLARYKEGVQTAGLASSLGYETDVVRRWLFQLNGLGICTRTKHGGGQGDLWQLREEYRDVMVKFQGIQVVEEELKSDEPEEMGIDELDQLWQEAKNMEPPPEEEAW